VLLQYRRVREALRGVILGRRGVCSISRVVMEAYVRQHLLFELVHCMRLDGEDM